MRHVWRKKGSEMTSSYHSKTFYMWNVCAQVCFWATLGGVPGCKKTASHGEAYCLSTHCVINLHVRPRSVSSLKIRPPLFLGCFPESSSTPGTQTQPGIDFWLNVHILLCPVTSTNLTNTNLISNNRHRGAACQVRCALRGYTPPRTSVPALACVSHPTPLPLCLFFSFHSSKHLHAVLLFHVDYITT